MRIIATRTRDAHNKKYTIHRFFYRYFVFAAMFLRNSVVAFTTRKGGSISGDTPSRRLLGKFGGVHVAVMYAHSRITPYTNLSLCHTVTPEAKVPGPQ